ncbi:ABC transporter substrate-binding protein [Salinicola corii]|uniref:Putative aliphatic sulfonates-binding protein n=1 Tax=Salinicola corii TaxID=2606937 RepID=A0A640WCF7_9GAMM|nr:ABC transporter substrate-binding protein [Salinicola corii]KAA0017489.1 ABC transporter substrate-binding protein [Salinicola corii]
MRPTHRLLSRLLPLAVVLLSVTAQADPATLRIADQKGNMRAQLEAANALTGIDYRIQWSEFPAAAPLVEALNASAVDAGIIGDAPLVFALAAGAEVKAIAVDKSNPYGTAVIANGDSDIKTSADLAGKRIAVGRGSIGHLVALKALESAGLSAEDAELRFMGPVDARIALANGSVDAWGTWEPYTSYAELVDGARVVAPGNGLVFGNSFVAATDAATDAAIADPVKRAALQDYLARLQQAQIWSYQHIDEYARKLAQIIGFPEAVARQQYVRRELHWEAIDDTTREAQQKTANFYHRVGLIPEPLDVPQTFDTSFSLPAGDAR